MRSKLIISSIFFSSVILFLSLISIDTYNILPIKSTFNGLTAEAQKQVTCLAENIYFEAAHEPLDGKKAVAFVTLNRVQSGYADSICEVVQQKRGHVCQFSWYCDSTFTSKRLTIKQTSLYNDILQLSTNVVLNFERMTDVTNGATYYHADYVKPNWTRLQKETQIGRHIFYKSKIDQIDRNKGIISYE
jgi:spore germination cell wall hydrolase CwlJ-like protein